MKYQFIIVFDSSPNDCGVLFVRMDDRMMELREKSDRGNGIPEFYIESGGYAGSGPLIAGVKLNT